MRISLVWSEPMTPKCKYAYQYAFSISYARDRTSIKIPSSTVHCLKRFLRFPVNFCTFLYELWRLFVREIAMILPVIGLQCIALAR